jgi:ATP-dependent Zn protease
MTITSINQNIINMFIFDKLKTGNPLIDAFTTTIAITIISYCFKFLCNFGKNNYSKILSFNFTDIFYTKYIAEYEGKICSTASVYDCQIYQTGTFSPSFKALWKHIIDNINTNESIYKIQEFNFKNLYNNDNKNNEETVYIVSQLNKFIISKEKEIYAYTSINSEKQDDDNRNQKTQSKIEKINITIFSYKSNISEIKEFVETLTNKYLASIIDSRINKKFIYTLVKTSFSENKYEMWDEHIFSSTINFSNLFFEEKESFLRKLNFFLDNKEWYFEKGIPYSLGIGLHGPPGTGKTSIIKALAIETNSDIIILSMKLLKTRKQLYNAYFEDRYSIDNKKGSVPFDKKLIVFEDIDCIGDIVLDRSMKKKQSNSCILSELNQNNIINQNSIANIISKINDEKKEEDMEKLFNLAKPNPDDEPITLDDILNLWDGIRETPGRIMCISSNHYQDLDPALTRPGRIDISMELSYVSHKILKQIYEHLFNEKIEEKAFENVKDKFYTPAELISIYMNSERNPENFIKRLEQNEHLN